MFLTHHVKSVKTFGDMLEMSYLCSEQTALPSAQKKSGVQDSRELCTPY
jgi:hypothetical protein